MSAPDLAARYGDSQPIAIIGAAARFPQAATATEFWRKIADGIELTRRIEAADLAAAGLPASLLERPDFVPVSAVVEDAAMFDAAFFGYSPQEADSIDPQQRLFLTLCWEALDSTGLADAVRAGIVGVYGAARLSTYQLPARDDPLRIGTPRGFQALIGNDKDYLASRVAYKLRLTGPALTVQTACSSSLVAVHLACEQLRAGECELALAGGVGLTFPQAAGYLRHDGMIFSKDGHCRPFDAAADGTTPGNGAGVVLLKPLDQALADGDPVLAVIRGSAVNNDGADKVGFTAPSVEGQAAVLREAYAMAEVDPATVGLIEAHGTATPLGDPIEVEALRRVFGTGGGSARCALGSVKSNLGHADTAAGIAALLKAAMALDQRQIPPSLHFETPNPALELDRSPFFVPTTLLPWRTPPGVARRAGVSSFGIGGTNCHVVLEEAPDRPAATPAGPVALALSAPSAAALAETARRAAADLLELDDAALPGLAATAARRRAQACRLAVAGRDAAALAHALDAAARGEERGWPILRHEAPDGPARAVLLFTGQGRAAPAAGAALYRSSAAFRDAYDRCAASLAPRLGRDLAQLLATGDPALTEPVLRQPALVAFEIALARAWLAEGLQVSAVLGHSLGELAAAAIAGMLRDEDAMALALARAELAASLPVPGAMALLRAGRDRALALLAEQGVPDLALAADNGPDSTVISGPADAVRAVLDQAGAAGIGGELLAMAQAFHSPLLDPILDDYEQVAARIAHRPPAIPLISTATGALLDSCDAAHWRRHLRHEVRFAEALRALPGLGITHAIEVGPSGTLCALGQRCAVPGIAGWLISHHGEGDELYQLRAALAAAAQAGLGVRATQGGPARLLAPGALDARRHWRPQPAFGGGAADAPGDADPAWQALTAAAAETATAQAAGLDLDDLAIEAEGAAALHAVYAGRALAELGCFAGPDDRSTAGALLRGGLILPRHRQLLQRLLRDLATAGVLRRDGDHFTGFRPQPLADAAPYLDLLRGRGDGRLATLIERAGARLADMLAGRVDPVAVIFPEGASDEVEDLYQNSRYSRFLNAILARAVAGFAGAREPLRILEIGAGTGGTTWDVVQALTPGQVAAYRFTDIGPLFLQRARAKFAACPFMTFARFDIEQEPAAQGVAPASQDVIIAANVLHNARDLTQALARLRPALAPGGVLLLREITAPKLLFDFVFGPLVPVLDDLDERQGELFAARAAWARCAAAAGFAECASFPAEGPLAEQLGEHVLALRAPGAAQVVASAPSARDARPAGLDLGEVAEPWQLVELLWRAAELAGPPPRALAAVRLAALPAGPVAVAGSVAAGRILLRAAAGGQVLAEARRGRGGPPALALSGPRQPLAGPALQAVLATLGTPAWIARLARAAGMPAALVADADGAQVLDRDERVLLDLRGVIRRRPAADDAATLAESGVEAAGSLAYRTIWQALPAPAAALDAPVVLLGGPRALAAALAAVGAHVTVAATAQAALRAIAARPDQVAHLVHALALGPLPAAPLARQAALIMPLLELLPALAARQGLTTVTVATSDAVAAAPLDETTRPDLAGLLGLLRCAANEQPQLRLRLIDLAEPGPDWAEAARWLVAEVPGEPVLAQRGAALLAPRLERLPAGAGDLAAPLDPDALQILTGGLSELGLAVAHWLADHGAKRLALLARRPAEGAGAAEVASLRARGVLVEVMTVDVAEPAAVTAALCGLAERHGRPGALFHLAGTVEDGLIGPAAWPAFERALGPKWLAALALDALPDELRPARTVLFSSAATLFGPPGQAAHATANALLEALAERRCARGHDTVAIAWGFWSATRAAERAELAGRLAAQGMEGLPTRAGLALLGQALAGAWPVLAGMRVDWTKLAAAHHGRPVPALLAGLTGVPASTVVEAIPNAGDDLAMAVRRADGAARLTALQAWLRARIGALTQTAPASLAADVNLVRLGLDSLMFLDLAQTIASELGIKVSAEAAFRHETIAALAAHMALLLAGETAAALSAEVMPTPTEPLARRALRTLDDGSGRLLGRDGWLVPQPAARHDVFPLPPAAATLRRAKAQGLPLAAAAPLHYVEWDREPAAPELVEAAWQRLRARHDMLRVRLTPDGALRLPDSGPAAPVELADLRGLDAATRKERLLARRAAWLAPTLAEARDWPARLAVSRLGQDAMRLHLAVDGRCADAESVLLLRRELARLLAEPEAALPELGLAPRDYVSAQAMLEDAAEIGAEAARLANRLAAMPPAPLLPLAGDPQAAGAAATRQLCHVVDVATWTAAKDALAAAGLSPTAGLLAALARSLAASIGQDAAFALELRYAERLALHPDVPALVGDFAAAWPIACDPAADHLALAAACQGQLDALPIGCGLSALSPLLAAARPADPVPMTVASRCALAVGAPPPDDGPPTVFEHRHEPRSGLHLAMAEEAGRLAARFAAPEGLLAAELLPALAGRFVAAVHDLGREQRR
jgi:yersiniabactin nonribosomal peptide/polyketide synthase